MRGWHCIDVEEGDFIARRVVLCCDKVNVGRDCNPVIDQSVAHGRLVQHSRSEAGVRFTRMSAACTTLKTGLQRVVLRLAAVPAEHNQPGKLLSDADTS